MPKDDGRNTTFRPLLTSALRPMGCMEQQILIIFLATFMQVFFIALQTVAIQLKSLAGAALCATCIAGLNIVVLGRVISPQASGTEIAAYVLANAIAVPSAMIFGHWVAQRKN